MHGRRHQQRTLLLVLVAVGALAVGVITYATGVLERAEVVTVDARFDVRGERPPPDDVVLVGLDATSLAAFGERPPIPRRLHAQAIDRLRRAGARAIAYDFEFTQPTTDTDDNALFDALERAPGTVLATTIVEPGRTLVLGGYENLRSVRAIEASTNYPPQATRGGVYRKMRLAEGDVPSFPVAAAERATGRKVDPQRFAGDGAWIDFAGPAGTIPTISLSDLVKGRVPAAKLKDKVVVVGATNPGLQDIHPAATGPSMPGPEIQANAIATILAGFPLRDAATWLSLLFVALAALATPLSALRLTGLRWLPVAVVTAVALPVVAQLAFDGGRVLPVVAPALALLVAFLGTLAVAYAIDVRERRYLRTAFARFVPADVVDRVADQAGEGLRLGGTQVEATVLFCDLRGFTAFAHAASAERVIDLLNVYLGEMSDAILDHGGTVVSYMGDGIMAVFGAPLPQADHADRAVATAREMLGPRLAAFNARVAADGLPPFAMGIGIDTGPVMSGNVGSARRLEYTAVGDTTNTAARLETMTKEAGVPVLLSDATRSALSSGAAGLRSVAAVQVRGHAGPLAVWTLDQLARKLTLSSE